VWRVSQGSPRSQHVLGSYHASPWSPNGRLVLGIKLPEDAQRAQQGDKVEIGLFRLHKGASERMRVRIRRRPTDPARVQWPCRPRLSACLSVCLSACLSRPASFGCLKVRQYKCLFEVAAPSGCTSHVCLSVRLPVWLPAFHGGLCADIGRFQMVAAAVRAPLR
jgi:hypothetical protein